MSGTIVMRSVTPAQVIAVVGAILGALVAFGADVSKDQQDSILNLVQVVSGVLLGSDALIRFGRSRVAAAAVANGSATVETAPAPAKA